jgi:hypothetical protein
MSRYVKNGVVIVLMVLSMFLFFGCGTALDEPVDSGFTIYSDRTATDSLFNITRNGVQFVGTRTATNSVTLTMLNTQSVATVTFTVNIYYSNDNLYTSSPRSYTIYQNEATHDYFYLPTSGYLSLANIIVTR